ncbi:MAG TPA: sulfotransferase, partial [Gemmatimonadaceae bacterium]|nr:sulfotransferase [Gemmatimonadaceae bacterium]
SDHRGPIFVLGCGRSGTTLLRLMLNSHPRIAIPGETWYFPELHADRAIIREWPDGEWRDRLTQRITSHPVFPELGISRSTLLAELDSLSRDDWPSVVALVNLTFARTEGKPRWGDKTPGYVRCLPVIKELFPNATVLHVIRDGRDVVLSFLEQPFGPTGILQGADYWKADVERGQQDGPRLFDGAYHEVRYEELVAEPERVLRDVCNVIGESYDPAMLEYHDSAHRYLHDQQRWHDQTKSAPTRGRSERWKREMARDDEALFELAAGPLLQRLGYPLTRTHSLNAYRAWAIDRLARTWHAAVLRTKVTAYRLTHRKCFA